MPIRLLIFDLDGTLVDSSQDIADALNYAIKPYGVPEITVTETIALVGEGVRRLIGKVIEQKNGGMDESQLLHRFIEYYSQHLIDHTLPYPGTEEALQHLWPYSKAVVSNKNENFTVDILGNLGLLKYFDYVAGGDTISEKKPSPAPVLRVLKRFGVEPNGALLVGDSIYDMEAGRRAGLRRVAAMYGYGSPGFSEAADYRISSIGELPALLAQIDARGD